MTIHQKRECAFYVMGAVIGFTIVFMIMNIRYCQMIVTIKRTLEKKIKNILTCYKTDLSHLKGSGYMHIRSISLIICYSVICISKLKLLIISYMFFLSHLSCLYVQNVVMMVGHLEGSCHIHIPLINSFLGVYMSKLWC